MWTTGFLVPPTTIQIFTASFPWKSQSRWFLDAFRRYSTCVFRSPSREKGRIGGFDCGAWVRTPKPWLSSQCWFLIMCLKLINCSLWHSRKLASPLIYGSPLPHELALKPPAYHRLVQTAPDGRKTLYLAAHAKIILGRSLEDSQKLIWELIGHCTQPKVNIINVRSYLTIASNIFCDGISDVWFLVCVQHGMAW
jgi:hypothetical protein